MNDKDLDTLLKNALPGHDEPAPEQEIWQNIREHLPQKKRQYPAWGTLLPAGAMGLAGLMLALYFLIFDGSDTRPSEIHANETALMLEQLNMIAPVIYQQNKPAMDALAEAIFDVRSDLQNRPEDRLLIERLEYYQQWQNEMLSGLLILAGGETDVSG